VGIAVEASEKATRNRKTVILSGGWRFARESLGGVEWTCCSHASSQL